MAKKYKRNVSQSSAGRREAVTSQVAPVEKTAAYSPARRTAVEFNPDYTHILADLKRIGILAGSFVIVLIILSFYLNR